MMQSQSLNKSVETIPKKEQWAIINQYKAMEFQRLKQLQKMNDKEKKKHFKDELDQQMSAKSGTQEWEKEEDRRYYEYITKKTEEMRNKEEREKQDKIIKRKLIEEDNQYYLYNLKNSRKHNDQAGNQMDIGVKSEQERKRMEEIHKKEMLDTLDQQLQMKEEQKKYQKYSGYLQDQANLKYQYEQFDKRKYHPTFRNQNPAVYQNYKNLDEYKRHKEHQLDHVIVEEAAIKKKLEEDRKIQEKEHHKSVMAQQMLNTLHQQVQMHKIRDEENKKSNPEDNTYKVIGNIFKERQSPYNKRDYAEYLKKQAEQRNAQKQREKYMSEEEYRFNMNQLNRAVSGNYKGNKYLDRSVGAIGNQSMLGRGTELEVIDKIKDKVHNEDSETVRMRLEALQERGIRRSRGHTQNSHYY